MVKRIYILALAGALVAVVPQSVVASSDDTNVAHTIVLQFRESVLDNWEKLSKWCRKTTMLHAEMPSLPDSAWFGSDKQSQRKKIHEKLMDIRKLLLSTDAQKIMERIDDIDECIADVDEDIRQENEKRVLRPDKRETIDENLGKLRE